MAVNDPMNLRKYGAERWFLTTTDSADLQFVDEQLFQCANRILPAIGTGFRFHERSFSLFEL